MGILSTMIQRRSAASNPRDPAYWVRKFFGGGSTARSGVEVDEQSAFSAGEVFACIRNLSEDCGKLPLKVYRAHGNKREEITDHPLRRLLDVEPNPEMTAQSFRESLTAMALLRGNGYAEIEYSNAGQPLSLWPIHPSRVEQKRDASKRLFFSVLQDNGTREPMDMSRVYHLKGFTPDGISGAMVLDLGKESIGLALAVERFAASFFGNGAIPGGIMKTKAKSLTTTARDIIRREWGELHSGTDKAHRLAILEGETEYEKIGNSNEESQFLETRQFSVETIARWFRMPPHKIGHLLRATGWSTLEATNTDYLTDALLPWLKRWENEGDRKLLKNDPTAFLKHNVDALLRGDSAQRAALYNTMTTIGAYSINDVRRREDMNPIEDGDRYLVQRNLVPIDKVDAVDGETAPDPAAPPAPNADPAVAKGDAQKIQTTEATVLNGAQISSAKDIVLAVVAGLLPRDSGIGMLQTFFNLTPQKAEEIMGTAGTKTPTTPNPNPGGEAKEPAKPAPDPAEAERMKRLASEHANLLADCYRRILHTETDKVKREAKKAGFDAWATRFYAEHPAYVRGGIGAAVEACAGSAWVILRNEFMPPTVKAQVAEMAKQMAQRHIDKSLADLAGGVDLALAAWGARAEEVAASDASEIVNLIIKLAKGTQ